MTDGGDYPPTNSSVYGFESTQVQDVVRAATVTKQFAEQREEFLKAIFPNLASQAELEDQMGLAPDEEFIL